MNDLNVEPTSHIYLFQTDPLPQTLHGDGHQLDPGSYQCVVPQYGRPLELHRRVQCANRTHHLHYLRLQAEDLQTHQEEVRWS